MTGLTEILLILAIVALIFGARYFGRLGEMIGKASGAFRKGLKDDIERDVTPKPSDEKEKPSTKP